MTCAGKKNHLNLFLKNITSPHVLIQTEQDFRLMIDLRRTTEKQHIYQEVCIGVPVWLSENPKQFYEQNKISILHLDKV